jgi:hypothetical protein
MGRIGYFRRVQGAVTAMIANSQLRWFEQLEEAKNGQLTASRLFRDMNASADETWEVWRNILDLDGSPILPHIHVEGLAIDVNGGGLTGDGDLNEAIPEKESIIMTPLLHLGPAAVNPPGAVACVAFRPPPGGKVNSGVDREAIQVLIWAPAGGVAPPVGYYTSVVLRYEPPFNPGRGRAVATVSVQLS